MVSSLKLVSVNSHFIRYNQSMVSMILNSLILQTKKNFPPHEMRLSPLCFTMNAYFAINNLKTKQNPLLTCDAAKTTPTFSCKSMTTQSIPDAAILLIQLRYLDIHSSEPRATSLLLILFYFYILANNSKPRHSSIYAT
jgi:hypothetical protein